ncbi:MAG: TatD family hydrolase [bacterium]
MLIDTHCHLDDDVYENDREEIIRGFEGLIINCGTNLDTSRNSIELSKKYKNIYATAGLHPNYANCANPNFYEEFNKILGNNNVVAIGECGLDFYRNLLEKNIQEDAFRKLIKIANQRNLPLIIHSRDAMDDTIRIIKEEKVKLGVLHSFSGTKEDITRVLDLGLYISITGVITFKNSKLKEIVSYIPKNRIMFETDSPYLTPEPFRGKRNIPNYVRYVYEKYADACGIKFEEAIEINYNNAKRFFAFS